MEVRSKSHMTRVESCESYCAKELYDYKEVIQVILCKYESKEEKNRNESWDTYLELPV